MKNIKKLSLILGTVLTTCTLIGSVTTSFAAEPFQNASVGSIAVATDINNEQTDGRFLLSQSSDSRHIVAIPATNIPNGKVSNRFLLSQGSNSRHITPVLAVNIDK